MNIADLGQLDACYDHIYLSPHLDDAVLSCAGTIVGQRAGGQRVLVVTLCTAAPDPAGPFSQLALDFHRQWALAPAEVVGARLREDQLAMERVAADHLWAGMLDAIYRAPRDYDARATLFGTPAPDDPLLPQLRHFIAALRARQPDALLYAPLGVGRHVDHQITHLAARDGAGGPVLFYEDFPYVAKPGALEQRLEAIDQPLRSRTVDIAATLARKLDAIRAYASQLDELFGGVAAMERSVADYARRCAGAADGQAERLWLRDG